MEIKQISLAELKPYRNNPRQNDKAIEAVANSIKEFGFKVPIVIDKNNVIVAGHTRVKAALSLGMTEVPCIVADDLTDQQIDAFRLADNKTAELADWDMDKLELEMMAFDEEYLSQFGFEFEFDDDFDEEAVEKLKRIDALELKAFEHHDYLVFVFDNQHDWLQAVSHFDIKQADAGYGKTKKVGVGRVLHGKRLLEEI